MVSIGLVLMAAVSAGKMASAQTLVLTQNPVVTDIYSSGVVSFPATNVGVNAAKTLTFTVTGGALKITSITIPTSTVRLAQFTVGAITGCTVNGTTSNPTNTTCTVPVTFNPAYVGYQTSPIVAVTSNGTFSFGLNGIGVGPQAVLLPGTLSTIAGNGKKGTTDLNYAGDGGQATAAQVVSHGFVFDALGNIYEAEYGAVVIRKITTAGVISTVAGAETTTAGVETSSVCALPGNGTAGANCGDGGQATAATFGTNLPDIALDSAGNLYIADSDENRIRRVDAVTGIITTIVGTGVNGETGNGGAATAATLNTPEAIIIDAQDNLYILDANAINATQAALGSAVRFVSSSTGIITKIAGNGTACTASPATPAGNVCGDNGPATAAAIAVAASMYLDPVNSNLYIADRDGNRIRLITHSTGVITTVAGTGVAGYTGDGGPATSATLSGPHGIWVDPGGDLYIADRTNNVVRYVSKASGVISTIVGGGAACAAGGNGTCGDGGPSNGPLANLTPDDIRFDPLGNLYVADQANYAIRKVTTNPVTLTFPTVPVGTTAGPLTATLTDIGNAPLTYTIPSAGSNASVTTTGPANGGPSTAFAQGSTTTCGPIFSGSGTTTLAAGATCVYSVTFTPDTVVGNYTGTLVETDNSFNAGPGNTHYPTSQTQTVSLIGAATQETVTIAVASNPNPSTYGQLVPFVATINGGLDTSPTGTMTFSYTPAGSTTPVIIGTAPVQTVGGISSATLSYALLPVGVDSVVASYGGDTNYKAAVSPVDPQTVNKGAATNDTLTAAPTSSTYGAPVLLTFTVPTTAGAILPSGGVTFTSGGVTLGTGTVALNNGVSTATLTTTALPVGTDTVTATYVGDANYAASAPTAIETVAKAAGTDTLTATPANTTLGQTVTLLFTVPTVAGATAPPSGTVTFTSGGTTLGTATLTTKGTGAAAVTTATLTTTALPSGTDVVTGTYPGDANYPAQAPTATETVGASTGTDTLTLNPTTSNLGTVVAATFTIPLVNGVTPTGTVTFTDTPAGSTTPVTLATVSGTLSNGVVTANLTQLPVGNDTITANYTGDTNYAAAAPTATETVNKAPGSTDTLIAAPTSSTFGSPVVLTFTVPAAGAAQFSPTGTVTFTNGTTTLGTGTLTTTGTGATRVTTATLTTSALPVGTDTVIGTYPGDANYGNAAPTATETVAAATPVDTLTFSPTAPTFGSPVVLTFTVPPVAGASAPPTGTVTFTNGSTQLGTGTITTTGGVSTATITTTALPVGSDLVTAAYPGNTNYAPAAPTATVPVTKATGVNDTLTATPTSSTLGSPVTLTFTVPTVAGATASPTGTVTFTTGTTTLGTGTLSTSGTGANAVTTATLTTTILPLGSDTITGTYAGDTNYAGSAPTTIETVASAGTDTVTASPSPSTYGAPVTVTFTVPTVAGAATSPTGTVTFTSGGVTLGTGTIGANGTATITTTALPVGTDTITANYPGSPNYPAASPTTTEVIAKAVGTGDTLTANPTSSTLGSPVLLTFTIPAVAGAAAAPSGTVTFTSGGVTLGTGTLSTKGGVTTATLTTTTLPVGTDTVTGTYLGDINYAGAAPTATETVAKTAGSGDTLTATPASSTFGAPVLLTFTVAPVAGVTTPPTGTVTFTNGATILGTGVITTNGGVSTATLSTSALPVGTDLVTGAYPGDANYGAAAPSPTATVTIAKASGTGDTLTANPTSSTYGSPVVLTFTIPTVAGATASPTGTIVFSNGTTTLGTGTLTTKGTGANAVTTATVTTSILPLGTDTVTGTYTGDTNYAAAAPTTTETVNAAGTDSVSASPSPATYGAPVTITFTVPTVAGSATSPTGTVTFTSGGVTLGTGTIATLNGVSTATITTTVLPVGTDTIQATYAGSPNYPAASPTTSETINKGNPIPVTPGAGLTTSPNPSNFGQAVTITQTLTTTGALAPTGSVTFFSNGAAIGTATVSGGIATISTSTLPVGTDPITSTYTGDANYATGNGGPVNQVVNQAVPTATLAAGPNPTTYGTLVTLTESIAPINGTCPAGPATFLNNGTPIGTGVITLTGGSCVATLTSPNFPVGTDQITATVPASGGFVATTTGPVALIINKANGPDTLAASPNPSVFGSPVTITDTIPTVAGVTPTGTVNFFDFGTQIGTGTVTNGVATLTTTTLPVGTDSLTATYLGDGNYAQVNAGPVNEVVTAVVTVPTLSVGPNPATFGTPVTFNETIPTVNGVAATGTVLFYQNGTLVGPGTLTNGVATITTSTLPVGTDPITATYAGDKNYGAANSGPVNEVINKANGPDTLTVNPDPSPLGNPVVITDTIPTVGGVAPTGTVTFYDNGTPIGTGTVTNGVATLTSTTLPVGTDPITAVYGGDPNYAPITSGPVNEVITVGNTTPALSATPNPTTFGTPVTITESIPGINGISPTGTVTFLNNGAPIGTATVTNGVATLVTSTLPIGTDPITATYTGDQNYAPATSGPLNVVITKAAPLDTLSAAPNPSVFGAPVTLTFTVPPVNGVVPTGVVSFYDGTTLLGTGTVNAQGIATLTTSQLPFGTSTITAKYPGDNNYAPASPTAPVTVSPVSPISVVTVPPGSPICGASVTLTDTITVVNGVALGGTVQFFDNGTAIGNPVVVPASGIVTLVTTGLACTTDVITAVYTPPANSPYLPSTGGPTTIVVQNPDFSIAATPPNQTVNPGDTATYTVSLSGVGLPFTSPVTLTATGLPPGATVTFANPTYVPGAGPTNTTMTIVTAPNQAMLKHSNGNNGVFYGLLLLPLLGVRRIRRKIRALPKGISYCLAALVLLGGLGAMTGCGGGYFGPNPQTFTITVTGTSGTLVHSTTVTLTVR